MPEALPPQGQAAYAWMEVIVQGQAAGKEPFRLAKRLEFDVAAKDAKEYHFSFNYAAEKDFSKNAGLGRDSAGDKLLRRQDVADLRQRNSPR